MPPLAARTAVQLVPQWTLADRLRKARVTAGMHQREFADQLDVKRPAYAAWESGRNQPQNVVALAKRVELVTGVPAAWLLGVHDEAPRPEGRGADVLPHLDSNQEPAGVRHLTNVSPFRGPSVPIERHGVATFTRLAVA